MLAQDPQDRTSQMKFMQRFHGYLIAVLARELKMQEGSLGCRRLEALLLQVYLRLFDRRSAAWPEMQGRSETAICKYLEIVAIRIVLNNTRLGQMARKAGGSISKTHAPVLRDSSITEIR